MHFSDVFWALSSFLTMKIFDLQRFSEKHNLTFLQKKTILEAYGLSAFGLVAVSVRKSIKYECKNSKGGT